MYSWGGSTDSFRGSTPYEFDSARSPYLDKLSRAASKRGPRIYATGSSPRLDLVDPKGRNISSDSENPIVFGVDVTGSMSTWPAEIFDRLPLIYQTLSQYRPDVEISFGAIGDAYSDDYPLQVNNFGKELELEDHINALYPEGGGGGQISETYELFGHYLLNHADMPNAKSPFLFIFGDEMFYKEINPAQVEHYIGDKLQSPKDSKEMWDKLQQKFNIYFLQKDYGWGDDDITKQVTQYWSEALGSQKVIHLPSKERAVDVAMGIIAKHWGQYDDFGANLSARQADKSVRDSVHRSIRHIPTVGSTRSVISRPGGSSSLSEKFDDAKSRR